MRASTIFSSLTRISPLAGGDCTAKTLPREQWATGDYVLCEAHPSAGAHRRLELPSGRLREVVSGDRFVGALGVRYATLEATGTWEAAEADGRMHLLTSAGLVGKCTSRSPYIAPLMEVAYAGHVLLGGEKATMRRFVEATPEQPFKTPVLLIVGTSMSAGKTSAARVLIRRLPKAVGPRRVLGAKLAGAGRLRDILSMADAGADPVFDFVDVGLPSTVLPEDEYRVALRGLLARMAGAAADVAVVEIGSSPLEPYNGAAAIEAIRKAVRATVLCASDPYAAKGVMEAFGLQPTFVAGIATNTHAGIELIEKLCGVPAFNLLEPAALPEVDQLLRRSLADGALATAPLRSGARLRA